MPSNKKLLQAAAGNAGESVYVDDVFSTYLYDGNSSTQTITNGLDLSGEGGLVWTKNRTDADPHILIDSRDTDQYLISNATDASATNTAINMLFNANGYSINNSYGSMNYTGENYTSWTFRKAEKFFDVVTYTGTGSARTVSHNLGSVPAVMIIKRTSTSGSNWRVYHTSLGNGQALSLNTTDAAGATTSLWNSTTPTDSVFTLGDNGNVNQSGQSFVAYLFASDAGGFGDDGSENIIKCGSVTTDGSGDATVTLGFEPQWVMLKRTDGAGTWAILDTMRGYDHSSSKRLMPNVSDAEENYTGTNILGVPTATGFTTSGPVLDANSDYIYIAIRRPMKTPESGTEVFAVDNGNGSDNSPGFISGFPIDMGIRKVTTGSGSFVTSRLTGLSYLRAETNAAEVASTSATTDYMNGWASFTPQADQYSWMFKRATGFMDAVAYTGDGTTNARPHNLGVVPELMICKWRANNTGEYWYVYHASLGVNKTIFLQLPNAEIGFTITNSTAPTSTHFTLSGGGLNTSNATYIAYLFATLAGVSKVGSYTGTGNNLNVDCGFSAGARFILIKRTDSTGDWYVWDSVRGIVAGNDPYLLLNSTAAQVTNTDYVDPLSSGFTVTSSAPAALNASGGSYIFLAIAQVT